MTEETTKTPIKKWAEDDRPREKMLLKGINALSNAEIFAILISKGYKEDNAVELGKRILNLTNNNLNALGKLNVKDLQKIKGIGSVKAITIAAALELGRRRQLEDAKVQHVVISSSKAAYRYFEPRMSDLKHEEFWVAYLSRNQRVLDVKRLSEGGVAGTVVDPRMIFKYGVELLASSIILSHNHPSGSVRPSAHDIHLTHKIVAAGKTLDITVADHLIIGSDGYYSFADEGTLACDD